MVESIPVVHVYPTLLCEDVPQLCLPCQLHGLNSVRAQQFASLSAAELADKYPVDLLSSETLSQPEEVGLNTTVSVFLFISLSIRIVMLVFSVLSYISFPFIVAKSYQLNAFLASTENLMMAHIVLVLFDLLLSLTLSSEEGGSETHWP